MDTDYGCPEPEHGYANKEEYEQRRRYAINFLDTESARCVDGLTKLKETLSVIDSKIEMASNLLNEPVADGVEWIFFLGNFFESINSWTKESLDSFHYSESDVLCRDLAARLEASKINEQDHYDEYVGREYRRDYGTSMLDDE